jgi:translation initiation factor IF-1
MQIAVPVSMNTAKGTITLVQEERFQLDCDDGKKRLFVLSHDAPLESDELVVLKGARVEVDYDDQPDTLAHTAHRLRQERPNENQARF